MGNRCVITTEAREIGVYMHWNGNPDFVASLLKYCKRAGFRRPESDCYGWARLCQVAANYFGGTLSIGIDQYDRLDTDNGDNGVYIIRDWEIVGREFGEGFGEANPEIMMEIDKAQPEGGNIHD